MASPALAVFRSGRLPQLPSSE
uniref:Uncharacterized protein n=1 Tax=Arundo donax TaxID=35708 RepID=A0A0A8ZGG8_ARUDO